MFQENLKTEPFWMVVGCILVNKARWNPGVYTEVRRRWPTASRLANASQEELERVVSALRRAAITQHATWAVRTVE